MRDLDNIFLEKRIHELEKNGTGGGRSADKISYNNAESGLTSNTVQGAIDEVHEEVENIKHHYSTEEKVVGEWIDGSLIYEKTFILESPVTIGTDRWSNIIQYPNIKTIFGLYIIYGATVVEPKYARYNEGYIQAYDSNLTTITTSSNMVVRYTKNE